MANKDSWVSLHTHSAFSMLDGAAKTDELVQAAVDYGMPGLAVTDHGYMYGAFEYYNACKAAGIKFIPGLEAYIAPGSRFDKRLPEKDRQKTDKYSHMTLLAVTTKGYHNLVKISSLASLEGFYYNPRADRELLDQYSEGIVATTGCVGGEVAQLIYRGRYEEAKRAAGEFSEIFGKGNFYVELMKHGIEIEEKTYPGLIRIAKELNLPLLATNDLHYTHKKDAVAHDALLCLQTGATIADEKRFRFQGDSFYLKSPAEMRELFSDYPEAIDNTLVICDRADVTIESGKQLLPAFPLPEGATQESFLLQEATKGLNRRYKDNPPEASAKQLEYELGVINQMGFSAYFSIVADLVRHAKEVGIRVGPGRGCLSADTNVLTPFGFKKINDIAVGDLVFDETGAQVPVSATFEYYCDEPLVEIQGHYGVAGNKMTADHKVLVRTSNSLDGSTPVWVRADQVKVGDYVTMPKLHFGEELKSFKVGGKNPSVVAADKQLGHLLGLFVAKGSFASDDQIIFEVDATTDTGLIFSLARNVFNVDAFMMESLDGLTRKYVIQDAGVRELFNQIFPKYNGQESSKYIPRILLSVSATFRSALLEGIWGKGTAEGTQSVYYTSSPDLAETLTLLLSSLGLPAGIQECPAGEKAVKTSASFGPLDALHGKAFDGSYVYYQVHSVKMVAAEGKVYDFTVPTTHSYVTDSYVVHNSAAGSMLAYVLGITELDPIEHGLIFERFLNPERISMPDIDIDFDDRRRSEMIEYAVNKYGYDKVAQIVTYGTFKAKQALKDSARVLGLPYSVGDQLTKAIPGMVMGKDMSLKDCFDPKSARYGEASQMREFYKSDADSKSVIDTALGLEGLKRQVGVHAAGVIISDQPIIENVPVWRRDADGAVVTQYDMGTCEKIGLLKMDFLGLRNLTIIDDALREIKRNKDVTIVMEELPLDDAKTYQLLQEGETVGVFQLESSPMRTLMRSLKPTTFGDISALIALYRPGPMGVNAHNDYADRKNGRKPVIPIHPEVEESLQDILGETYSLIVYQEQIQRAAQKLAGYTLGQADLLRRAMGKKNKEILDKEYVPFRDGMRKNGYSDAAVQTIWNVFVPFADYAFNKSHSAAYGLISYWTAYLKAHYPVEYMAALLTAVSDEKDKTAIFLHECRKMGIKVLPPDVNISDLGFTATGDTIRFGLGAVRSVGAPVVAGIVEARNKKGNYVSFDDYVRKTPASACKKNTVDALIKAGAFDSLGHSRRGLNLVFEEILSSGAKVKKAEAGGQLDLFSSLEDFTAPQTEIPEGEWDQRTALSFERDMLGLYVSAHPLDGVDLTHEDTTPVPHLASDEFADRAEVRIAGIISSVEHKVSKQGRPWAATVVEDLVGSVEVMFFSKAYLNCKEMLVPDAVVVVTGTLDKREGEYKILAAGVRAPRKEPSKGFEIEKHKAMVVTVNTDTLDGKLVAGIKNILSEHPGELPVIVATPSGKKFPVPLKVDGLLPLRLKLRELEVVENVTFD